MQEDNPEDDEYFKIAMAQNDRKKRYLSPTKEYFGKDAKVCGYRDKWGHAYVIFIDTDYDGKVVIPGPFAKNPKNPENPDKPEEGVEVVYKQVCIVCLGPQPPDRNITISKNLDRSKMIYSWDE